MTSILTMISTTTPHHQQALTEEFQVEKMGPGVSYKEGPGENSVDKGQGQGKITKYISIGNYLINFNFGVIA